MSDKPAIPDREAIYAHLRDTLVKMFEIPADDIRADARLYEDLDIDSLDAVDLIVELRELTGIQVRPEQFQEVRTVGDVVDAVQALAEKRAHESCYRVWTGRHSPGYSLRDRPGLQPPDNHHGCCRPASPPRPAGIPGGRRQRRCLRASSG